MRILDSPGVVFDEDDYDDGKGAAYKKGSVLLRNVVKVEDVEDPIAVGESLSCGVDGRCITSNVGPGSDPAFLSFVNDSLSIADCIG